MVNAMVPAFQINEGIPNTILGPKHVFDEYCVVRVRCVKKYDPVRVKSRRMIMLLFFILLRLRV